MTKEDTKRLEEIKKQRTDVVSCHNGEGQDVYIESWLELEDVEFLISQAEKLRALESARARSAAYTHKLQAALKLAAGALETIIEKYQKLAVEHSSIPYLKMDLPEYAVLQKIREMRGEEK